MALYPRIFSDGQISVREKGLSEEQSHARTERRIFKLEHAQHGYSNPGGKQVFRWTTAHSPREEDNYLDDATILHTIDFHIRLAWYNTDPRVPAMRSAPHTLLGKVFGPSARLIRFVSSVAYCVIWLQCIRCLKTAKANTMGGWKSSWNGLEPESF